MADEKVKTRDDIEQGTVGDTPANPAVDAFETKMRESDEFMDIASSEVDHALSDDPETHIRQFRQQPGE